MSTGAASPRIHPLAGPLANQIAAGEVVERPASVIKELVENSVDAGARRIQVEILAGGVRLARVRDDGCGIHAADLGLALERHATSKIATLADLEQVRSMGFRGEALPSIASVARLEIVSCTQGDGRGARVRVEGGLLLEPPEPAAHPQGTTVTVRDLFFNTPARRKFLRTERTELRHVEEALKCLALAHFEVGFKLGHGGRSLFDLPPAREPAARERRVARLCGEAFLHQALVVDLAAAGLVLRGWIGGPGFSRGQSDLQYFFVNGRTVSDSVARHAVRQAYADLIPGGRHPAYVLYLELDPTAVDVNVHPSKHEVRFRDARLVHDFLYRGLHRGLTEAASGTAPDPDEWNSEGARRPWSAARDAPRPRNVGEQLAAYGALHGTSHGAGHGADSGAAYGARPESPRVIGAAPGSPGIPLRQCFEGYALALATRGPLVVDLRAASVWWTARRFQRALAGDGVRARPLLMPISVALDEGAASAVEEHAESLARVGLDLRRVSPTSVSVREIPVWFAQAPIEAMVEAVVAALRGAKTTPQALATALAEWSGELADRTWTDEELAQLWAAMEERIDAPDGPPAGAWARIERVTLEQLLARRRSP